ncbi:ATP-binding protein [Glaciecola sp. SC05]|uniref:PAS domain-containing sensor histidine kinase n=1 Tax=Glaciecola sp. SC05 TaxID=1987355 RepID=UPI0035270804
MITTSKFFEHMQYIYLRCSDTGKILDANKFAASASGIDFELLINKSIYDFFHVEDLQQVTRLLDRHFGSPNIQHTHRWKKSDGSYLWCKWQWAYSSDSQELFFMGEDVSEQKRVSSALHAIEKVTDTGYWEIDLSTKVLYWSQKVHDIHETDSATFKPNIEDGLRFYPEVSVQPLLNALDILETTGAPYNLDLQFITDKGNELTVNAQGFSEIHDGKVVRSFGTFKDLTKAKEDEASRQSLEQRTMLALEAAEIGVWEYDFASDSLVWDERLLQIFGKPVDTSGLSFQDWRNLVHPDDLDQAQAIFEQAMNSHAYFNHTFRILTDAGETKHILGMAAASYDDNGVPTKATGVNIDLTESERAKTALEQAKNAAQENAILAKTMAQKAKAADIQKSVFLANMSHEIRTPISGIMGLIDIMGDINRQYQDQTNTADFERYLDLAKSTSIHLLTIIGDILDFSKIEAGKVVLQNQSFNLNILLNDLMSGYRLQANEKGLYLDFKTQSIDSSLVVGDEIRLKQILYNLLSNALKFTDSGGITIRAKLKAESAQQIVFVCSVIDTGCGIDEDKVSQLFSPFEQLDSSSTKRSQGTGLGLSISNELAMLMGGKISVSSQRGKGSTFTLQLPFTLNQSENIQTDRHSRAEFIEHDFPALKASHILVVEDNEINQVIITTMLTQLGLSYALADDGITALETLKSHTEDHFDLILLDCQMPRLDGYETTRTIRSFPAMDKYASIPIIALTANAMVGDRQKCLDAGMDDYIAKPLDKSVLIKKLAALIK